MTESPMWYNLKLYPYKVQLQFLLVENSVGDVLVEF